MPVGDDTGERRPDGDAAILGGIAKPGQRFSRSGEPDLGFAQSSRRRRLCVNKSPGPLVFILRLTQARTRLGVGGTAAIA